MSVAIVVLGVSELLILGVGNRSKVTRKMSSQNDKINEVVDCDLQRQKVCVVSAFGYEATPIQLTFRNPARAWIHFRLRLCRTIAGEGIVFSVVSRPYVCSLSVNTYFT